eukprot:CAMPEP_0183376276 /NCGR_PEP_ID=MMETSP0164_2-20130417/119809_1 /TAXON_ID=221442 /ORGANISM="Coccolithus pelagicus ssp braarudi, Strain PLY182g" /LENGTH=87 /DNA_ID=CAMNT_0025553557 /DNA_START=499 /DNA_END=758 /DNA_ORIENTATION=+
MAPNIDAYSIPCTIRASKRSARAEASSAWTGLKSCERDAKRRMSESEKLRVAWRQSPSLTALLECTQRGDLQDSEATATSGCAARIR